MQLATRSSKIRALSIVVLGLFLGLVSVSAQESAFKLDGKLGANGTATVSIPVQVGDILLIRVGSLDFNPNFKFTVGTTEFNSVNNGPSAQISYRSKQAGTLAITIAADEGSTAVKDDSFQVRATRISNPALKIGDARVGTLTKSDYYDDDKARFFDYYPMALTKGQKIVVSVSSNTNDAWLGIENAKGDEISADDTVGTNAVLTYEATTNETIMIAASIYGFGHDSDDNSITYAIAVNTVTPTKTLAIGGNGTKSTLKPASAKDAAVNAIALPFPDQYILQIPANGIYKINVAGQQGIVPYLVTEIQDATKRNFKMDGKQDEGVKLQVFNRYYFRKGQQLNISVYSHPTTAAAGYTITAVADGQPKAIADGNKLSVAKSEDKTEFFVYKGKAKEFVQVEITSYDFDTLLEAGDAAGVALRWDDYTETDPNMYASLGGYYFEAAGEVVFAAGAYSESNAGDMSLIVQSSASGKVQAPVDSAANAPLTVGKELFTRLSSKDKAVSEKYLGHEFTLTLKANQVARISAKSLDTDLRLIVLNAKGTEVASGDDTSNSLDPAVEFVAEAAGAYKVQVLTWMEAPTALNHTFRITPEVLGTVSNKDEKELEVDGDSPVNEENLNYVEFKRTYKAGQNFYVTASSSDLDTKIEVYAPNDDLVTSNDNYQSGQDARVYGAAAKAGTYTFRIVNGSAEDGSREGTFHVGIWDLKP